MNPAARPFPFWRSLSPVDAVRHTYRAISEHGDQAMFISLKAEDEALDEAARLAQAGAAGKPLFGLPFVVKDNIDVGGLGTTCACPAAARQAERSAFAVARLQAAGAICLGKTNLDQFATGLVGVRSPYGTPRNTLDPELVPGGSSSGSATAVGAGICAFALGTDTAGSGRVPAALNGIVGLKPSLGLLSSTGMVPACRSLDTISVFAATVADAVEATAVAQGYDAADFMSRSFTPLAIAALPPHFTVGVPMRRQRQFFGDRKAEEAFDRDLASLEAIGGRLREIDFEPFFAVARLLYEGPWVAERYHATRALIESAPEAMHPVTRAIISGATKYTAVDTFDALYKLGELRGRLAPVIAGVDCLAVPSIPTVYTVAQVEAEPVKLNSNLGTYTNFVNLLDLAAISVPVGRRADDLPSSLTLIGKAGSDGALAAVAAALEHGRRPTDTSAPAGHMALAVVGAHLSGMPLNHELVARGAVFLRETTTAPDYRLYALAATKPAKPGLLRVQEGQGVPVVIETWALSPAAFGEFVAAIPSPLGIGTLRLSDGGSVKGFLVEAEAVRGARDISDYRSWRAFVAAGI